MEEIVTEFEEETLLHPSESSQIFLLDRKSWTQTYSWSIPIINHESKDLKQVKSFKDD